MTALTADRNTKYVGNTPEYETYDIEAATKIFLGALCYIDVDGNLNDGAGAKVADATAVAVAKQSVNNTGAAGALTCEAYYTGRHVFVNGGTFTKAALGDLCYIKDDQTVGTDAGSDIVAGRIKAVTSTTVTVDIEDRS